MFDVPIILKIKVFRGTLKLKIDNYFPFARLMLLLGISGCTLLFFSFIDTNYYGLNIQADHCR